MTKEETLRLALDTLKEVREETFRIMRNGERLYAEDKVWSTIIAIQEALETKDEPVAWMYWQSCLNDDGTQTSPWVQRYSKFKPTESVINKDITPLYTTPQRTWVGLKDDDEIPWDGVDAKSFARAIEAKLKEKNGY